jgi:hypothetical protein
VLDGVRSIDRREPAEVAEEPPEAAIAGVFDLASARSMPK